MLKIDPEIQSLIPPLTAEEQAGLEASIEREGCRDALVVWAEEGILLDGHNRLDICKRQGKPYDTKGLPFPSREAAKSWVIKNQFSRRNLSVYQRVELALKLEALLRPQAEANIRAAQNNDAAAAFPNSGKQVHVDEEIAKAAGVSRDTIHRVRVLGERVAEPIREQLRRGETSIHAEYTRLKTPGRLMSSASVEWYTPARYIEAARYVLGEIDVDPASCEMAQKTVRAARLFTQKDDGLAHEWPGRVWLNPPYGGLAGPFVERLVEQCGCGVTSAAVVLLTAGAIDTKWFAPLWDFVLCICDHRIAFLNERGELGQGPIDGSVFVYLGPDEDRFIEVFEEFGPVVRRVRSRRTAAPTEAGLRGTNTYGDAPDV